MRNAPKNKRPIHNDFQHFLNFKNGDLIRTYTELRAFVLEICPECNELLYHTHALTSVYSLSGKLSDGFCHIPIYSKHLNLGFNKGTLLNDPKKLLSGTGKLIRHIKITKQSDYNNQNVIDLIEAAIDLAKKDMESDHGITYRTISKIKI